MAQLVLTADQAAIITSLETPMENAFAEGVLVTGGSPAVLPPYEKYIDQQAETKDLVKNSFKSLIAAYVAVAGAAPAFQTISTFSNGYSLWGDGNYHNGVLRYWKDGLNEVHVQGLVKVPASGSAIYQAMFTMPVNFRPAPGDNHIVPCVHNDAPFAIEINSAGTVSTRMTPVPSGWIAIHTRFRQGG